MADWYSDDSCDLIYIVQLRLADLDDDQFHFFPLVTY